MKSCEICGAGPLRKIRVSNYLYKTSLGDIRIEGDQSLSKCVACKEVFVPGKLISKWNQNILRYLIEKKGPLSAQELKFAFAVLPYSQSEIAYATSKQRSTLSKYKTGVNPVDPLFDHTLREIIKDHLKGRRQTLGLLKARKDSSVKEPPLTKIKIA